MFDPNQAMQMGGGQDFVAMQAEVERQRKLAEMLRRDALQSNSESPQGRMVGQGPGAQFVAPSIFQYLAKHIAPALNTQLQDYEAKKAESQFNEQAGAHANQWRSALPQALAARAELPGPQAEGGSPELAARPEIPVDREQILKHTLEGMRNPLLKTEAPLVNQSLTQDLNRTEDREFRDEQARTAASERRDALLERLKADAEIQKARLEDRALDRASREAIARQHAATMAQIAQMRLEAAQATKDQALRTNSREFRQDVEALSRRTRDSIPMIAAAKAVDKLFKDYTDPKTGKVKDIEGLGLVEGALPAWASSTKASTNRQKFQTLINAVVRDQAGLSQTLAESERTTLELMAQGRARQDQIIAAWPSIIGKLNAGIKAIEAGYDPSVVRVFNERGGGLSIIGEPPAPPAAPTAPTAPAAPKPLTPAEQAELDALKREVGGR